MLTHETGSRPALDESDDLVSRPDLCAPFFEDDSHHRAVDAHLIAGTLPLKFAYTGSAAWTHVELARSTGYQSVIGTVGFEVSAIMELAQSAPLPRQMVEVGPGNGFHTVSLLDALEDQRLSCEQYVGMDFSRTLLDIAARFIRRGADPRTVVMTAHWDIESGPSAVPNSVRRDSGPILLCLWGNTIGNVEDPVRVLSNIGDSMRAGDILLLGLTLRGKQSVDDLLAPYRTDVFRRAALEPFRCAGVEPSDIDFLLHCENDTVIGNAVLRRARQVGGAALAARHIVRCFTSRRFRPNQVGWLLDPARWHILHQKVQPGGDHMVVAASPRRREGVRR